MAYLYRHIRSDKNEPFYVGIGSDKGYKRAYNKKIKIYCPEMNIVFNSLTEASKILNKSTGNISNILHSKTNKSRNGLTLIKYEQ